MVARLYRLYRLQILRLPKNRNVPQFATKKHAASVGHAGSEVSTSQSAIVVDVAHGCLQHMQLLAPPDAGIRGISPVANCEQLESRVLVRMLVLQGLLEAFCHVALEAVEQGCSGPVLAPESLSLFHVNVCPKAAAKRQIAR